MKEAFEIGVSIAFSDNLSAGVAKAQQEIARLQKAVSASGLAIGSIRNTAIKTASVGGLSQSAPHINQGLGSGSELGIANGISCKPETKHKTGSSDNHPNQADKLLEGMPIMALSKATMANPASSASVGQISDRSTPAAPPLSLPGPRHSLHLFASDEDQNFTNATPASLKDDGFVSPVAKLGARNRRLDHADTYASIGAFEPQRGIDDPSARSEAAGHSDLGPMDLPFSNWDSPRLASLSLLQMSGSARSVDGATTAYAPFSPNAPVYPEIQSTMLMPDGPAGSSSFLQPSNGDERSFRTGAGDLHSFMTLPPALQPEQRGSDLDQDKETAQRQSQGDVFLDGVLVGRWVSRYLRRESERANNGPNGFNPRRSQLLPGVTVG